MDTVAFVIYPANKTKTALYHSSKLLNLKYIVALITFNGHWKRKHILCFIDECKHVFEFNWGTSCTTLRELYLSFILSLLVAVKSEELCT